MNKNIVLAAIGIAAISALLVWSSKSSPERSATTPNPGQTQILTNSASSDRPLSPGVERSGDESNSRPSRESAHPENVGKLVNGTVAREWGTLIKARDIRVNCRDVLQVIRAVSLPEDYVTRCDTETEFEHAYALFSDEQLEQIAAYDAEAAYLLSYRRLMRPSARQRPITKEDLGDALSLAMRALILTGDKQAFDLLIDGRHFRNRTVWSTVDGIPNEPEIAEKWEQYKWLKAGRNLVYIENSDFRWQSVSDQAGRYQQYFQLEELNRQAMELSDSIAEKRQYQ